MIDELDSGVGVIGVSAGRRSCGRSDLADIAPSFRFLLDVTPVDLVSARNDFAGYRSNARRSNTGRSATTRR